MSQKPRRPGEIFLSHSSGDRAFAVKFHAVLVRHGLRVWYAPKKILPAEEWQDSIGEALQRCDWFVVLVTPRSLQSMWVDREVKFVLGEQRFERRILPVLLEPCDYKRKWWVLGSMQHVDFRDPLNRDWAALLRVWSVAYAGRTPAQRALASDKRAGKAPKKKHS